jgi:co-chaperonin GroES (HSP10)
MPNFEPTHDWIVVELVEEKEQEKVTNSGLVIASGSDYDESKALPTAKVVSVGPGYTDPSGKFHEVPINIGDSIIYMHNSGIEHEEDDVRYYFVNYRNSVIAIKRGS